MISNLVYLAFSNYLLNRPITQLVVVGGEALRQHARIFPVTWTVWGCSLVHPEVWLVILFLVWIHTAVWGSRKRQRSLLKTCGDIYPTERIRAAPQSINVTMAFHSAFILVIGEYWIYKKRLRQGSLRKERLVSNEGLERNLTSIPNFGNTSRKNTPFYWLLFL